MSIEYETVRCSNLHLAREWGWNDTEVRDAMYVETKQRGWCRE